MKDNYLAFKEEFDWEDGLKEQAKIREDEEDKVWINGFLVGAVLVGLSSCLGIIFGWILL